MKRLLGLVLALAACGDDGGSSVGDVDAGGSGSGEDSGFTGDAPAQQECGVLHAVIRDFKVAHPDFAVNPGAGALVPGIVQPTITVGGKPVLSPTHPDADLIEDATSFGQWYTDVTDVNMRFEQDFTLPETPVGSGIYVYDEPAYFPIDGMGFGNEIETAGQPDHNYHFTTELHASFPYKGGEQFTFRGDDDVWVYVNGKLAIDIGGVHGPLEQTIDFDAKAAELGITVGNTYAIDFFQAERHVTGSSFKITTSIACFVIL